MPQWVQGLRKWRRVQRELHHPVGVAWRRVEKLVHQARLADTGLSFEDQRLPGAAFGVFQGIVNQSEVVFPADERRPRQRHAVAKHRLLARDLRQLEDHDRPRLGGQRDALDRRCLDPVDGESQGVFPKQYGTWARDSFHSRRQIYRLSGKTILARQVVLDRLHQYLSGTQPDPHGYRAVRRQRPGVKGLTYGGLNCLCGKAGPKRMIFLGDGHAENRHDSVAEDLGHGTFETMDAINHYLKNR